MKLTASQERELLRIYRAQPDLPSTETIKQRADRRGLEKAGALLWVYGGWWELTAAGRSVARELAAREGGEQ